jgi:kumamolisin
MNRIRIPGTKPRKIGARRVRPVPPSTTIEITVLLRDARASGSGAWSDDLRAVRRFAAAHRLRVVRVHAGARTMVVHGRARDLAKAFAADLFHYERGGHVFRSHRQELTVPRELAGIISGVFGLDNRPVSHRPRFVPGAAAVPPPLNANTKAPPAFRQLYAFPTATGHGQCVGVLEFGGGFEKRKLNAYLSELGVKAPKVTVREIVPGRNRPVNHPGTLSADVEVYMDLEILAGVAPGATLVVYFAENTNRGWLEALHEAIFDSSHRLSVLSISWGQAEQYWDAQALAAIDDALQMAAARGITICCSSGDRGVFEGNRPFTIPFPASSPHVLACGGTRVEATARRTKETVWNESRTVGLASGGGISRVFDQPAFQRGHRVPGRIGTTKAGRGIPDVAANASSLSGYLIIADDTRMSMGGTSAAAPLWAGLIACVNEALGRPVGYLTPLLYTGDAARRNALRDITEGNNKLSGKQGYRARRGWDPCTGLGTPHGLNLLRWLKAVRRPV